MQSRDRLSFVALEALESVTGPYGSPVQFEAFRIYNRSRINGRASHETQANKKNGTDSASQPVPGPRVDWSSRRVDPGGRSRRQPAGLIDRRLGMRIERST